MHFYVFAGPNEKNIAREDVDSHREHEYQSFDDFKNRAFNIYEITFPANTNDWRNSDCTCPWFFKKYMCKHIIAIAYRLGILKKPNKADQPLEAKKKAGRPKKATPALVID